MKILRSGSVLLILVCITFMSSAQSCWKSLATGRSHTVAVKTDGTLWTWGNNEAGQLGNGSRTNSNIPLQIGASTNWKEVFTTENNTFAIKNDGALWAWGSNTHGSLGDGTETPRTTPVRIGNTRDWKFISSASESTFGIKNDGSLWAWGWNMSGQLGDGTTVDKFDPVQIGSTKDWKSVSGGLGFTVAIKTDGTLWTWGNNYYKQLGYPSSSNILEPTKLGTDSNWESISAGVKHSLAIRTDGTLWAWGNNDDAQIGNGERPYTQAEPVQIGMETNWKRVIAGGASIALKSDGTIWVWGLGALDPTYTNKFAPSQLGTDSDWESITVGMGARILGTKANGETWVWGENVSGALGLGLYSFYSSNIPRLLICPVARVESCWKDIKIGEYTVVGLREDGSLWQWGLSGYYSSSSPYSNLPYQLSRYTWKDFDITDTYILAIRSDGTLWGWGNNALPIQIGSSSDWKSVARGNPMSYAIKTDGSLWSWTSDDRGENIYSGGVYQNIPTQVAAGTQWKYITATEYQTAAIRSDGTLWVWGGDFYGSLGNGPGNMDSGVPVQTGVDTDWATVSVSEYTTAAIKTDGTLWACGDNRYRQLGDGTTIDKDILTRIGTESNWKMVAFGGFHTLAVKTDGKFSSWGSDLYNRAGYWLTQKYYSDDVLKSNSWKVITANELNSFVIHTDGTLFTMGYNQRSELGDGLYNESDRITPFEINCSYGITASPVGPDPTDALDPTDPIDPTDPATSIISKKSYKETSVYPNPNNGSFYVKGSIGDQFTIYDAQGLIMSAVTLDNNEQAIHLNIKQGIYFYMVQRADGQISSNAFVVK